eukprot:SAG11_NODE_1911_length_4079_cov_1.842462_4_plen_331_part_00
MHRPLCGKSLPPRAFAPIAKWAYVRLTQHRDPCIAFGVCSCARFDARLKPEPLVLLQLYSAGCYHCQQLEPHYEAAAAILAKEGTGPIPLARMNLDTEEEFANKKFPNIEGTPTLVVLREGREQDRLGYSGKGADEVERIVQAMREQAFSPFGSHEVATNDELHELRSGLGLQGAIQASKPLGHALVFAVLDREADGDSSAVQQMYSKLAAVVKKKIGFAHSYSEKLAEHFQVHSNTLIVLSAPHLGATTEERLGVFDLKAAAELSPQVAIDAATEFILNVRPNGCSCIHNALAMCQSILLPSSRCHPLCIRINLCDALHSDAPAASCLR